VRGGVDVVELAGANRPDERTDGESCDEQGERKHDVERKHQRSPRKARDFRELARTVSELAGMSNAAMSGWMTPATASAPAQML